jgi:hypothetical protein
VIAVRRHFARRIALVATVLVAAPLLTGCWQGLGASSTMQNSMNSGNGTQEIVGSLRIENATVVRNEAGRASLVMAVFNQGDAADTLAGVSVDGQVLPAPPVTIEPGSFATFGYGAEGAPADWQQHFISQYATMHPWETVGPEPRKCGPAPCAGRGGRRRHVGRRRGRGRRGGGRRGRR